MKDIKELRKIGHEKILKALKLKASYPYLFDKVLELFYKKREFFSVEDICTLLNIKEQAKVYYMFKKLVSIEFLEMGEKPSAESGARKYYKATQLMLDFFRAADPGSFDTAAIEAITGKNCLEALLAIDKGTSWSELRRSMNLGESSIANVLKALEGAELVIKKENKYFVAEKGKILRDRIQEFGRLSISPYHEVQLKLSMDSLEKIMESLKGAGAENKKIVHQKDYYLVSAVSSADSKSYLRYRVEQQFDNKGKMLGAPKHILTWTERTAPVIYHNIHIVRRKREEINIEYPSVIFFLEYLGAKIQKEIEKKRWTFELMDEEEGVKLNLDELYTKDVRGGKFFVEIKTGAYDEEDARRKCDMILRVQEKLGLKNAQVSEKLYYEI